MKKILNIFIVSFFIIGFYLTITLLVSPALYASTCSGTFESSSVSFPKQIMFEISGDPCTGAQGIGPGTHKEFIGQSIKNSDIIQGTIYGIEISFSKTGNPTDDIIVSLRTDIFGEDLASQIISASSLPTHPSYRTIELAFNQSISTDNVNYLILRRTGTLDSSNYANLRHIDSRPASDVYPSGDFIECSNTSCIPTQFYDVVFKLLGEPPSCTEDTWSCNDWSACSAAGQQTRSCEKTFNCSFTDTPSPATTQSCSYTPPCSADTWECGNWGTCSSQGIQTRICTKTYDCPITNTFSPATSQSCTPECTEDIWSCGNWGDCSSSNTQTRNCTKIYDCSVIDTPSPKTSQSCTYTEQCTEDIWECGNWGDCSNNGTKTRSCSKTYDCSSASTASPSTSQSCTYVPPCTEDVWECEEWSECSPLGIKTRNCKKTYDCSTVETTPNNYQSCNYAGNENTRVQHEAITKSTVQLLCFNNSNGIVGAGSGTVINSSGVILTNKHVIKDRNKKDLDGCYVGFTTNINNYPDFKEVAFILDQSVSEDMALLKIYNGSNNYSFMDINSGNSQNLSFSKSILAYGYPIYNKHPKTVGDLIQKITFSSGNYSGDLGSGYFKTTAMLEHGISGGGAYTEEGVFTGITSAGLVGETNTMGLVLGINNVKNWINSTGVSSKLTKEVSNLSGTLDFYSTSVKNFYTTADNNSSNSSEVVKEEKRLITKVDNNLSRRVSGNILLQVEQNGEGWYVYPDNKKKYYLGRPADAFSIMRNLGLGIKHSELDNYLNSKFPSRLAGKIMLDVEQNGEAYYINPNNLKGHYLNRPADAFRIMRELGLGITNSDIRKIDVGEVN